MLVEPGGRPEHSSAPFLSYTPAHETVALHSCPHLSGAWQSRLTFARAPRAV